MSGPLEGLRVLDFSRYMAGPHGTQMLADYGADVIKVEPLPGGEGSRQTGTDFIKGESALFLMWNRGKRSIALDLRKPEGLSVVRKIAATADVVVENYRPGVADTIGIGYDALSEINPRIIYCSVTAFGPTGPLAGRPGTDPIVQAVSGVMSVTGEADGDPLLVGIPIADFTGAMLCAQGVMLGLIARERTGRGQHVDVSMLYGLLSGLTTRLATYWATGEQPQRFGSQHSVVVPYQAFRTADGFAVAGVWGPGESWPRFCEAIDRPDLAEDPRYATNADRVERRDEMAELLGEVLCTRTTAEWEGRFAAAGALFGPIYDFGDILDHPQVREAGLVQTVEHPTLGSIPQLGPPILLSDTPGGVTSAPPVLGQHTTAVLEEVGYNAAEVEHLEELGIVVDAHLPSPDRARGHKELA